MGFPSFVVLDEDGELLAAVEKRTVEGFEAAVAAAKELKALDDAGKAGDAAATKTVLLKRIGWQAVPHAAASAALAKLDLTDEERTAATRSMLGIEMNEARLCTDKAEGLKRLLKIHSEGRLVDDPRIAGTFWRYLSVGAETLKHAEAYGLYVEYLRGQVEKNPRMKTALDAAEQKLAAMKQ